MAETTEYLKRINAALALRDIPDYNAALVQLRKAVKLAPEDASVYLLLGLTYQDTQDYNKAETNFRKALSLQPDLIEAQQSLGIILVRNRKFTESVLILKPLADADPTNISVVQALANAYSQTDNQQEAIKILQIALQFHSANKFLVEQLAIIFITTDDKERAKELLEHALKVDPSSTFLNLRGAISITEQKPEEARKYFEEAIKYSPDEKYSYANLAQAYLLLQQYEKALNAVNEVLAKKPGEKDLKYLKAKILYSMGRYEETLTFLENLESDKQNFMRLVVPYYVSLLVTGKTDNALHVLQRAYELVVIERRKIFINIIEGSGVELFKQKYIEASKSLFEQVFALVPESARSINNLGFILLCERNWKAASELFMRAEQQGYESLSVLKANQGYIALNTNKLDNSIALFHEALSYNDSNSALLHIAYPRKGGLSESSVDDFPSRMILIKTSVLANLATAYFLHNELDKAFSFANQAIESDPEESVGYRVLGSLYCIEGNKDQARRIWEKALLSNRSETEESVVKSWILELEKQD